jgi:hypothetical protein
VGNGWNRFYKMKGIKELYSQEVRSILKGTRNRRWSGAKVTTSY